MPDPAGHDGSLPPAVDAIHRHSRAGMNPATQDFLLIPDPVRHDVQEGDIVRALANCTTDFTDPGVIA